MYGKIIQLLFLLAACIAVSCVKEYTPEIKEKDIGNVVIYSQITDVEGMQTVDISKASKLSSRAYLPLKGCLVTVSDNKGNSYTFDDLSNGKYTRRFEKGTLTNGIILRLKVLTPDGEVIESDAETMPSCPPIDSVYWVAVNEPALIEGQMKTGARFYVDLNGKQTDSRYYRWEAIETYEYHTPLPLEWYYNGTVHHIYPPDSSKMVCWQTGVVNQFFSLSTANLKENRFPLFPLHFVDNTTQRLAWGYSLLVNQYAITENAFNFMDKVRLNSNNTGGLYMKQPIAIQGNLHNLTTPDHKVLGYFGVASMHSKRIFIDHIPIPLKYETYCSFWAIDRGLGFFTDYDFPVYLQDNGQHDGYRMVQLNMECFDCTRFHGTTVKPDFWPN